jgi:RimJ/RimL family protein N-acetyltransferase
MSITQPAMPPPRDVIEGRYARLAPLDVESHGSDLWRAVTGHDEIWRFMAYGPFVNADIFLAWLASHATSEDPLTFAILDARDGRALGLLSLMEIRPAQRVIEVGHILFPPGLRRSRIATEAIYLVARRVFDLGYRRLEWKCDNRNEASKRAASRFGFTQEGLFRQHMIVKGENRDTAWFAMIDRDWPASRKRFEKWLSPANFDADARQTTALGDC